MDIHLLLKSASTDFLPTDDKLDKFRKEHQPEVEKFLNPFKGVEFEYVQMPPTYTKSIDQLVIPYSIKKSQ